ncbi:MAG: two-component system sensor histidine kinase NtrB [Thermoguttaceae bacterium]
MDDITERKLAAETIEKSDSLYRSLVDHLPLYVLRKDLQGRFTFANDSLCQLLGKPRAEILGKTDFDFYPRELAEKYVRDDREVIARGRIFRAVEEHRAADGDLRHVEVLKTPVRGADDRVVETQTVFLDVTDRVEAERRLVQSERLAAIGAMVAGVAHESRNALQQMQACCSLLRWRVEGDEEAGGLLSDLEKAQDRLLRLFEDLRGYAAPVTLDPRSCNVRDVAAEAWSALTVSRAGRDATLHEIGSGEDAHCRADPLRLQQVFCNILENALGACEDPVVIEVEISDARIRRSPALRVVFRDNGPGFTPAQQQRAFEPFYTTKTTGTGLGMAIAERIVEAHQGTITVGNRPTRGAEIRITLPREPQ